MANIGDHWALGFIDGEAQPAKTSVTGSTIVAADDFGDLGDMALTNNIAFFMSPEITVGSFQVIIAWADASVNSPVQSGITPDPANITFWMSDDDSEETALALANYVDKISGGTGTGTILDTVLGKLTTDYGMWNSKNTVYSPFVN
tara:strand:+ start:41 stop:478 length:438 start_codon:yes stop_codon:yes gene_type:complete